MHRGAGVVKWGVRGFAFIGMAAVLIVVTQFRQTDKRPDTEQRRLLLEEECRKERPALPEIRTILADRADLMAARPVEIISPSSGNFRVYGVKSFCVRLNNFEPNTPEKWQAGPGDDELGRAVRQYLYDRDEAAACIAREKIYDPATSVYLHYAEISEENTLISSEFFIHDSIENLMEYVDTDPDKRVLIYSVSPYRCPTENDDAGFELSSIFRPQ
ncbi:hypothetical protein [Parvularcula marina]|uniref:hypothetical protein n=1 Tax=Parvularcula marina TaxID=2292771 RepID=UPI003518FAA0